MDEVLKRHYRELLHRFKDQLAAAGDDAAIAGPGGTPWQVHGEPDGGMVLAASTSGGMVTRIWQPAPDRLPDYPADLPFLAGTMACTVVARGPTRMAMVQWWNIEDAAPAFERLIRESLADGWEETGPMAETGAPAAERRRFVQGSLKRIISRSRSPDWDILTLVQAQLAGEAV